MIQLLNIDCMEYMATVPDKHFDLAIVDPPYGIGEDGESNHSRGKLAKPKLYTPKNWDNEPPPKEYFKQLRRVSKNQIIWGANHFMHTIWAGFYPRDSEIDTPCWIVWDKENGENDFADCELAWTSFKTAVRCFKFRWAGMLQGNMKHKEIRIHPTQKPIALYKWIIKKYSKPTDKILDTHLGSGSSAIAAHYFGCDFVGCEIDKDYFEAAQKRFKQLTAQTTIF